MSTKKHQDRWAGCGHSPNMCRALVIRPVDSASPGAQTRRYAHLLSDRPSESTMQALSFSPSDHEDDVEGSHPGVENGADAVRELTRDAQRDGARDDPGEVDRTRNHGQTAQLIFDR